MSTHSAIAAGPIDLDLLDGDVLDRLRPALRAADYTVGAVTDLLGSAAHAALLRDATVPGLRATGAEQVAGTALATLTRLWPLQAAVASSAADRALPGLVDPAGGRRRPGAQRGRGARGGGPATVRRRAARLVGGQ